jgi:hypothetical protein
MSLTSALEIGTCNTPKPDGMRPAHPLREMKQITKNRAESLVGVGGLSIIATYSSRGRSDSEAHGGSGGLRILANALLERQMELARRAGGYARGGPAVDDL